MSSHQARANRPLLSNTQIGAHQKAAAKAKHQQPLTFQWRVAPDDTIIQQPLQYFESFCLLTANRLIAGAKTRYSTGYGLESVRYLTDIPVGYTPAEAVKRITAITNGKLLKNSGYKATIRLMLDPNQHLALHILINLRE